MNRRRNYTAQQLSQNDLRRMQQKSWQMYQYFADFCDAHGLLYYACGGCCIGAVRNAGFVPWDDDIDVFMPRPDYEKLARLWNREADTSRYSYVRTGRRMVTGDVMAKICDENTTLVTMYQIDKKMPQGLTMDIFPLDGSPNPKTPMWAWQILTGWLFTLFVNQTAPENHGALIKTGGDILLRLVPGKRAKYRLWRWCEQQMAKRNFYASKYVISVTSGPIYMLTSYRRSWFDSAIDIPFEDGLIKVPVGYDSYLSTVFGDYMTPPPPQAQHPEHAVYFMDLDTPYRKYATDGRFDKRKADCAAARGNSKAAKGEKNA